MDSIQLTLQLGPGGIFVVVMAMVGLVVGYITYRNTNNRI